MAKFPKPLLQQPRVLSLPDGDVPYGLLFSRKRKTLSIHIGEEGNVKVYAPALLSEAKIRDFLHQKADWILQKRIYALSAVKERRAKTFAQDEMFLFLGKEFPLHINISSKTHPSIVFNGSVWQLNLNDAPELPAQQKAACRALMNWYIAQAKEIFAARLFHFCRVLNTSFLKISVRSQKNIWGSCHAGKRSIQLNWKLIMAPLSSLDYVIVHELCHLFHPNHSKRFWRKVASVLPDYKKEEKWLKDNRQRMILPDGNH